MSVRLSTSRTAARPRSAAITNLVVALAVFLSVLAPVVVTGTPTAGASGSSVASGARQPSPVGSGLSPEVAAVPAHSPALDRAEKQREATRRRLERDTADLATTTEALESATADHAAAAAMARRRLEQLAKTRDGEERLRSDLRALATEWFVTGMGAEELVDPTLAGDERARLERRRVLARAAADDTLADARFLARRSRALDADAAELAAREVELASRISELSSRRDRLGGDVARGATKLVEDTRNVELERLNATVADTDMSTIALDAYWRAATRAAVDHPGCELRWWHLAGIGRTESRHGTYGGSRIGTDGVVTVPILGPPLDGSNGFAVVPDSDGGAFDGTATTDRAVGPMQFLPSTWRAMGRDLTGDGTADPQNIYDAAMGAAAYLCRSGPLAEEARLRAAYLTYNRSQTYVDVVVGHAGSYRDVVPLP